MKIDSRLGRLLTSAIALCAITSTALVFCTKAYGQPKPLTVDDAIALARPITDGDPSVRSVEVRGRLGLNFFTYLYQAPESYEGLMAVGDPKFTFFAAANSRAIIYDPRQGELVYFTGLFPGIRGGVQDDSLFFQYSYGTSKKGDPSLPWPPGLRIDLPLILESRALTHPELQLLQGGKYRLIFGGEKWGVRW